MPDAITTTIVVSAPPFASIDGKEGVDLALVCAAFDHNVNLLFVDAGVLHLLATQDEAFYDDKMHDKQLKALEFYDVERVFAEAESLLEFNLDKDDLIEATEIIGREEINRLSLVSQHLVNF